MNIQNVVRLVEVRGSVHGMDQVASAYDKVASSSEDATEAMSKGAVEAKGAADAIARLGVQLSENYRQQQQFNQMMLQQERVTKSIEAANDNAADSYRLLGVEVASAANHLRVAAEAAYAFSPAFREVVNGMAAPALRGASTALVAVAAGIVTATNVAGKGLIELGLAAARTSTALAPIGGGIAMAGAAMASFNPTVSALAGSLLSRLAPALSLFLRIAGPILLVRDAVRLVSEAWELGGKKLDEYREIAEKAAAVDLSTQFFQRISKSATDAKLPVDELTASFKKLAEVTAEKLGGSDFQNRLGKLTEAGNFKGNTGVSQLAQANTTEEKFRAIVSLVDQAMAKGERLAALDLTSKFLSPAAQAALTANDDYLKSMLASADKIAATKLVSDADIGGALDLQRRYDAAVKILETRWHPIQDLLTAGGIKMHQVWTDIVETIAKGVDRVFKLGEAVARALDPYLKYLQLAANLVGRGLAAASSVNPIGPVAAVGGAVGRGLASATSDDVTVTNDYAKAVNVLAAGLKNKTAVEQAGAQVNAVQRAVWRDTSADVKDAAKAVAEARDQYDRAKDAIEKHTARMMADKDAIGLGVGAHEEFRAKAQLTTAAIQAQLELTPKLTAEIDRMAKAAGAAGQNLAVASAENKANFDLATVGLSGVEKQIAAVNFQLYGNKWKDYGDSATANTMRVTAALTEVQDAAKGFASDLVKGLMSGKTGMEALASAATNLSSKLTDKAITALFSGDFVTAAVAGIGAVVSGIVGKDAQKAADLEKAKKAWEGMADQVVAFNHAAAGFDLGPLTQALGSLFTTMKTLADAAYKAKDFSGLASIQNTFNQGVVRLYTEFEAGGAVLTDLQQSMKAVRDEETGLKESLLSMGLLTADLAASLDTALNRRLAELAANFKATTEAGLRADINSANGVGYLNDIAADVQKFTDLLSQGIDPNLLSNWLTSQVQAIVNDSGLAGDALASLKAQFPALANVVAATSAVIARAASEIASTRQTYQDQLFGLQQDQTTLVGQLAVFDRQAEQARAEELAKGGQALVDLEALQAAQRLDIIKKFNDDQLKVAQQAADEQLKAAQQAGDQFKSFLTQFTNTIRTYLDGLTGGSGSPLSPQARLAAAQSQYNSQLSLAQGGDQTAAGNITQYASNLLDAAKAYYASTTGFQTIFTQIQTQLGALPNQISATQQIINAITTQTTALQAAFATGSASAIATALLPSFDALNIAAGSGMTFAQFSTIAGGLASQATLQSVFSTLDTDGDGQISRLEAIKASTATTTTNIGSGSGGTATVVAAVNNVAAVTDQLRSLSNNTLPVINSTTQSIANLLNSYIANLNFLANLPAMSGNLSYLPAMSGNLGYLPTITSYASDMVQHLAAIRAALNIQSLNWGRGPGAGLTQYEYGTSSSIAGLAMINERNRGEIVDLPGGSRVYPHDVSMRMAAASGSNDNSSALKAVIDELKGIRARLDEIEGNTDRTSNSVGAASDEITHRLDLVVKNTKGAQKAERRVG